jgi:hypothetical protein
MSDIEKIMYQIGEILVLLGLFTTLVGAVIELLLAVCLEMPHVASVTMIYNIPEKDSMYLV